MLIAAYSRLKPDRLLRLGTLSASCAFALLVVGMLLFYCLYPWERAKELEMGGSSFAQSRTSFSYESIGSGALTLNAQQTYGWVSEIARELIIIAHNSRPDVAEREAKILIGLKNGKEEKTIVNGKTLYLKGEGQDLLFSETAQPIWFKPILLDNGSVLVEVGRRLGPLESPHSEEKGQFVAQPNPFAKPASSSRSGFQYAQVLKSARGWGHDLLIQNYGGREYQGWEDKYKIEFSQGNGAYACFVSSGDRLVWKEDQWKIAQPDDLFADLPVALVRSASPNGIEVTAWDQSGYYPVHVSLRLENPSMFTAKMEGMPSSVRLRTATQVSCLLGKKRVILRQGDWLLKTSTGWRNLKKKEDIEKCLDHRLRGELLIFDGMEKEQGRWILKGHLFDEMRTQMQPLVLPIDAEKRSGKTRQKRKLPFASKSTLPLWFLSDLGDKG